METRTMRKQIDSIFVYLFFIACWIFFFYFYPYHLHYKEQITLCVLQPDFLQMYLQKPAFLTEICGDYLTQFFLWTGGGSNILTLTFVFIWLGLRIAYVRPASHAMYPSGHYCHSCRMGVILPFRIPPFHVTWTNVQRLGILTVNIEHINTDEGNTPRSYAYHPLLRRRSTLLCICHFSHSL